MPVSAIRNIIFDLGGVILNINTQLTLDALKRLGWKIASEENIISEIRDVFVELEKGLIPTPYFRDYVRRLTGSAADDEEIDNAWAAMILDIPSDWVNYLQKLRSRYRLFLLSNTNEIHIAKFHREFEQYYGYPFSSLFERVHYSCTMGKRKPDPAIFLQVLEENRLIASETLFIDDVEQNVKSAESVGMKGLYIQPGTLLEALPRYLSNS